MTATATLKDAEPLRIPVEMKNPVDHLLHMYSMENAEGDRNMLQPNMFEGLTVALCGAGPSLPDTIEGVDMVIAVNSAVPFLGAQVDIALAIDQTAEMITEWRETVDAIYAVASTVDPKLVRHLENEGRELMFFHNMVAMDGVDEMDHYSKDWPCPGFVCGSGCTVVDRVIGLMGWLGFRRVDVYGADYCFADDGTVHANGDDATAAYGNPLLMEADLLGRHWVTRPDMLAGAVFMARQVRASGGRIRLMGNGLAVALLGMPDDFLNQVSRTLEPGESP